MYTRRLRTTFSALHFISGIFHIFFTFIFFGVALLLFFLENHKFSSYLLCSLLFLYFRRNINFVKFIFLCFLRPFCARRKRRKEETAAERASAYQWHVWWCKIWEKKRTKTKEKSRSAVICNFRWFASQHRLFLALLASLSRAHIINTSWMLKFNLVTM